MPLSEIRAYLDRRSLGELVALLEQEGALLDRKLRRLRQMRDLARQKAALIRSALARTPGVVAEEVQPEALLVCDALPPHDQRCRFRPLAGRACATARPTASAVPTPWAVCSRWRGRGLGPVRVYHFYTQVSHRPGRDTALYVRQAGRYLTLFHTGGLARWRRGYRRVLDHAAARGLPCAAPSLDPLLDELSVRGYENYALLLGGHFRRRAGLPPEPDTALPPPVGPAATTRCSR